MTIAHNVLAQLIQLPREQMQAELDQLAEKDPDLHAQVLQALQSLRDRAHPVRGEEDT